MNKGNRLLLLAVVVLLCTGIFSPTDVGPYRLPGHVAAASLDATNCANGTLLGGEAFDNTAKATTTCDGTAFRKVAGFAPATLDTCAASLEGEIQADVLSGGTNTTHRTRICACTSDGAASPAYAWQNLKSGTVGTATTCAD